MIIELANILDQQTCNEIIQFYEEHPEFYQKDDAQEMFNNTTMCIEHVTGDLARKFEVLKNKILIKAAQFYNLEEIYLDFWTICKWPPGKSMEFHADNVTDKREPHWYCWWRDFSAIVYLNHNYEGGRTVFKHQNQSAVPTAGTGVMFPSTFGYTHGVSEVKKNDRYTIALWLTKDSNHARIK